MLYELAVISISEAVTKKDCEQLRQIIGTSVKINGYTLDQIKRIPPIHEELALIIGPDILAAQIISCLPSKTKYILNRRSLDPASLNLLFHIPPNSEVLVVNDFYINAYELTDELHELNINSLRYFPYNPNDPNDPYHLNNSYLPTLSNDYGKSLNVKYPTRDKPGYQLPAYSGLPFQYAVTAGELQEVPKGIPYVIDIGRRLISIMTIADILQHFTGSAACDHLVSSRYIKSFVNVSFALAEQNSKNRLLQAQLETVIANSPNGILLVNEEYDILICNQMAENLLESSALGGKNLNDFLPLEEVNNLLCSEFIHLNDKMLYVTRTIVNGPNRKECFLLTIESLAQIQDIDQQYRKQKKLVDNHAKYKFKDIVYRSPSMLQLIDKAKVFAQTSSTILITGESGTGKELLAQAIHNASPRRSAPFIAINCAALTESLLESELFGYEEGAFTGARKGGKKGLFELAHMGTLFLDEIGDTPATTQIKLLRALQEKEILRVGGDKIIPVDVRIIAATNQDLQGLTEQGAFRRDLYFRLKILPLTMPPLRQRPEDIELLFLHAMQKMADSKQVPSEIDPKLSILLNHHTWPGNIRELENVAEYYINIRGISKDIFKDIALLLNRENRLAPSSAQMQTIPPSPQHKESPPLPIGPASIQYFDCRVKHECLCILRILDHAKKQETAFLGRSRIQQMLNKEFGLDLSFEQIKARLKLLSGYRLTVSLVGKGSYISSLGEAYCDQAIENP